MQSGGLEHAQVVRPLKSDRRPASFLATTHGLSSECLWRPDWLVASAHTRDCRSTQTTRPGEALIASAGAVLTAERRRQGLALLAWVWTCGVDVIQMNDV